MTKIRDEAHSRISEIIPDDIEKLSSFELKERLTKTLVKTMETTVLSFDEICHYIEAFTEFVQRGWIKSMLYQKNGTLNRANNELAETITAFASVIDVRRLA